MPTRNKEKNGSATATTDQRGVQLRTNEQGQPPAQRMDHPMRLFRDEMESLFERFFSFWPAPFEKGWIPDHFWDVGVEEMDKDVLVRAEAPGFEPNDFDVQITGNTLTIRAEHKQEAEEKQDGYRYSERRHSHFQRSIALPAAVEVDKVEARYRNGVLELRLPRTEEAQRRRIEVKA